MSTDDKVVDIRKLVGELVDKPSSREFYGIGAVLTGKLKTIAMSLDSLSRQQQEDDVKARLRQPTESGYFEPAPRPSGDDGMVKVRSDIFEVLRRHDVSEQCFAEIAAITHAALRQPTPVVSAESQIDNTSGGCVRCGDMTPVVGEVERFQDRVQPWMMACFGPEISSDRIERNHRFLEEALELVQALGCTASEAHQLVDYTFGRAIGEPFQEVGGVRVTLAALCLANGLHEDEAAEAELARIWTKVDKIRAKQAAKPKHSPLPEHVPSSADAKVREAGRCPVCGGPTLLSPNGICSIQCHGAALSPEGEGVK